MILLQKPNHMLTSALILNVGDPSSLVIEYQKAKGLVLCTPLSIKAERMLIRVPCLEPVTVCPLAEGIPQLTPEVVSHGLINWLWFY